MPTLLRIDSSARQTGSHSRRAGDYFAAQWLARTPGGTVVRRDLSLLPVPHIAPETITGYYTPADQFTPDLAAATALSDSLIAELRAADELLISTAMYNFSVPSALKAYIDQVVRIHRTFSYDGAQFAGLLRTQRATVVVAYGASGYASGGAMAAYDFAAPYLRTVLSFLGVADVQVIAVEATTGSESAVQAATQAAQQRIDTQLAQAA